MQNNHFHVCEIVPYFHALKKLNFVVKTFKKYNRNKNDIIDKNEVQQIRWSDKYWQYRVAAIIKEYHVISLLIFHFSWRNGD